jgi:hypothetical protein
MRYVAVLSCALVVTLCASATAKDVPSAFEMGSVALFTAEPDLAKRTGGSPTELGDYILRLKVAGTAFVADQATPLRISGAYLVAVKPGKRSRVWVHITSGRPSDDVLKSLTAALQSVEPPTVVGGSVAFGVGFRTWPKGDLPFPLVAASALSQYIKAGAESAPLDVLIELAWPDDDG